MLSKNEVYEILSINSFENNFISTKNWNVVIFEYLNSLDKHILSDYLLHKNLWIQVVIKKIELSSEIVLNDEFLDFSEIVKRKNQKVWIIFKENEKSILWAKKISEMELKKFIFEEGGKKMIYKSYIAINTNNFEWNIQDVIYNMFLNIADEGIFIRQLFWKELIEYVKSNLYNWVKDISSYEENLVEIKKDKTLFSKIDNNFNLLIDKVWSLFFKEFINQDENINKIISDEIDIERLKVHDLYKKWICVKWLPIDNINILRILFKYLQPGESISINIFPHSEEVKSNESIIDELINTKSESAEVNQYYMQLVINFSWKNLFLLNERIKKYKNTVWIDFYTTPIIWKNARYLRLIIWLGINWLDQERIFPLSKIRNLLF